MTRLRGYNLTSGVSGLYTISEKEEEYLPGNVYKKKYKLTMSDERQQKHLSGEAAQGTSSSPRVSSFQSPEKHGLPYGSAPDIASSGIYKVEDEGQSMSSQRDNQDGSQSGTNVKEGHSEGVQKISSLWSLKPKLSYSANDDSPIGMEARVQSTSKVEMEQESPSSGMEANIQSTSEAEIEPTCSLTGTQPARSNASIGEIESDSSKGMQQKVATISSAEIESDSVSTIKLDLPKKDDNQQGTGIQDTGTALQFKMDRLVEHISLAATLEEGVDGSPEMGKGHSAEDFDSIEILMNEQPLLTSTPNNSLSDCVSSSPEEITVTNNKGVVSSEEVAMAYFTAMDMSPITDESTIPPDVWTDAEEHFTKESFDEDSYRVLNDNGVPNTGSSNSSRRNSVASLLDCADGSQHIRKHRPTHAKIQKRLSKDFTNELENALKELTSDNPDQNGIKCDQGIEDSYSKNGIQTIDFTTGISNVSLSDFSQRNLRSHRPMCSRVAQNENQNPVDTGSKGAYNEKILTTSTTETNQKDLDLNYIPHNTKNQDDIASDLPTETSNTGVEITANQDGGVPEVIPSRIGRRKSDCSDEHSHYYHKQRPKHWTIQRRLSSSRLEHLPDGDESELQDDDVSSFEQEFWSKIQQKRLSLPELNHLHDTDVNGIQVGEVSSTGQDVLKNDLSVKFSDTVMVNIFSRSDSNSLSSATSLNDAVKKDPTEGNEDKPPDSVTPPVDQPTSVSPRKDSIGKLARPADIIKKKQIKQAEAMLSQGKTSKLTTGNESSATLNNSEEPPNKEQSSKNVSSHLSSVKTGVKSYADVDFNNPSALLEHLRDSDADFQLHHSLMNCDYTSANSFKVQDNSASIGQSHTSEYKDQGQRSFHKLISAKEVDSEANERIISVHPTTISDKRIDDGSSNVEKDVQKSDIKPSIELEKKASSEIFFPASSSLIQTRVDEEKTETDYLLPGYGGLEYAIPSDVVMKKRAGSITDDTELKFPTTSELFKKKLDMEAVAKRSKSSSHEEVDEGSLCGAAGGFVYTTPSKLLKKCQDREITTAQPNSPGYTALDHTTPSRLFKKWLNYKRQKNTKSQNDSSKVQQVTNKDSLDDVIYPTSSKLLQKRADIERAFSDYGPPPSYEEIYQTTSSELKLDKNKKARTDQIYPTSSALYRKRADRETTENKSPGYVLFDHTTPSDLLRKSDSKDSKGGLYPTSSNQVFKGRDQEQFNSKSRSVIGEQNRKGQSESSEKSQNQQNSDLQRENSKKFRISRQASMPKALKKNIARKGSVTGGPVSYSSPSDEMKVNPTPSRLLQKRRDREMTVENPNTPGYDKYLDGTTPSKLFKNVEERDTEDSVGIKLNPTPSRLLQKRKDREITRENPKTPEYDQHLDGTAPSLLLKKVERMKQKQSDEIKVNPTPSKLLQKRKNRETTCENPKTPGYDKYLDGATPSVLLRNVEERMDGKGSFDQSRNDHVSSHGRHDPDVANSSLDRSLSDSGNWTLPTPSNVTMDILTNEPSSPGLLDMSSEANRETCDSEKTKQQQDSFNDWRTFSDITAYYIELSDFVSKMARKMRMRSEPYFIGTDYDGSNLGMKDSCRTISFSSTESNEEIIEPSRIQGANISAEKQDVDVGSSKTRPENEPSSSFRRSFSNHPNILDTDEYVCNSVSTAYPLSSREEISGIKTKRRSSFNSCFTEYSDSASSDEDYQTGSFTEAKTLFTRDSDDLTNKSLNEVLWSLYLKCPNERKKVDSLASLLSLYFTNHAPSSSLMDFCSDSSVASTAHTTNHNQGRYEGPTQKKRNLPNMRSATPDGRGMIMEKEMMESQNRKLQMEISTLQTENKLLKDKYNRASAKINHLEEQLTESRDQLESLHGNLNQELSQVERRNKSQAIEEMDIFQTKIMTLTKENQSLKNEVLSLEKQLESAHKNMDRALLNSEKSRTLDANKLEIATLKDEVTRVKSLLEQSERHLQEEDSRTKDLSQQVIKLTEMKNLLQQQIEMGGGGATATDKQIKSLEKRLRVTEERLHQERADRANNLSQVEDKLLTENARLQATEKDLNRQLHREKDKNRNLENKIKDTREDNERLRLSLPFDEAALTTQKGYDIPYGVHASQRQETVKKDYRQIVSQLEAESGLKAGQEKDMICQLWNTRQQTYHQLRQLEITLQALNLRDNNIAEGLKNLRDVKSHADAQLKQLQEQLDDAKSEREIQETTYKEQLTQLVNERHDAFARLKTCEDLMEAVRSENEILKSSLAGGGASSLGASITLATNGRVEALQAQVKDLEGQIQQMTRKNCLLEGELATLQIQLEARDKALEDAQSELDIAHSHLTGDGGEDRKQEKIDKLVSQINDHQSEIKILNDKVTSLSSEKSRLERDLEVSLREVSVAKAKVKETKHGEMTDSKQLQIIREELEERDRRLHKLTQEYDNLEAELQTARQDLYAEQIQSQDYEAQIESCQSQIEQRGQILDTLSGTEKEQLAQFQILKETLDSVSQELNQKCAEMKVLQLEMSKEKDRYEYMEKELTNLKRDRPLKDEDKTGETSLPSHMLQIRELETERDHLKTELIDMTEALKQATEENGNLDKAMKQVEQALMEEKSAHLQTTAERGELEQHLEEIAEEHDALSQERDQSEEDIVRLEANLKDVVHKFEMEARKTHDNFASKYPQVPPEALKMAGELDSMRTLMEAKHKEHEMLNDKINRQQVEMDFLNRRVELLHNENQCNRDDIARLTSEVSAKIKEGVANREMNQFLVKERARLQKENTQLNTSVEKEKGIKERRRAEIADIMRKVEKTEESTKTTSREVLQKDAIIASLEAELGQTKQNCQSLESDRSQLQGRVENLQQDMENKMVLTSTLETRLETERGRESLDVQQQSSTKLQEEVNTLTRELESTKSQLTTSRETVEGLKQDKGAIYQEYDSMIRRLSERDQTIAELQSKCDRTEQQMQKELTLQKHSLERENTSTERELEVTKEENAVLKEELKQKEAQLSSFGRTLKELEDVNKEKAEMEGKVRHMESTVGDTDLLTQSLRKETMTLQETIARQQESLSTLQLEHSALRDKMRIQEEKLTDQILVLEKTNADLRNQYDGEKSYLKDNLMQSQTRVASVESSLASALESRDKLQINSRMQERSLEETKERLQEEMTSRKVAEQRAESLQSQLHELRKDKFLTEEKMNQMTTDLTKTEQMVKTEKERAKRLSDQQQELEATVYTQESSAKAKQEQLELQQNEIGKLRQILESQKQQLNAKLKKTTTELKQQLEIIEEDRVRVIQQNQLLSADVERARDQLAMKNKENLQLQETILGHEDQLRENSLQLRRAEDARKAEEELQSKLSSRFAAQEEELKRMKIYLSKKAEESGDNEKSMWMDLNRLIQDMNRQLHEHMESQKSGQDPKDRDMKQLSTYKKRVIDLESELSTEKAVHQITKSSLQALEEDNQRLRHQYHAMRRRDNVTSDKKYKSRMEAINEIIAKSQTQAQAMLAASGYYDDPQKSLYSPRADFKDSPDNSLASDLSFNSIGPMVIPPYTGSSPTKVKTGSPRK